MLERCLPEYLGPERVYDADLRDRLMDAIVAYYPGDGSERDFVAGRDGVLQGSGTTYVPGPYGGRIWHFDGNGYTSLPNSSDVFNFAHGFTLSLWVQPLGPDRTAYYNKYDPTTNRRQLLVEHSTDRRPSIFLGFSGGESFTQRTSEYQLPVGVLSNVLYTWAPDVNGGFAQILINGTEHPYSVSGAAVTTPLPANDLIPEIGRARHDSGRNMQGGLGEFLALRKRVNAAEAMALYHGLPGVHYAA